jgi:hypothetical protein
MVTRNDLLIRSKISASTSPKENPYTLAWYRADRKAILPKPCYRYIRS